MWCVFSHQEHCIRTTSQLVDRDGLVTGLNKPQRVIYWRYLRRLFKQSKKRTIRYALLLGNLVLLVGVAVFVLNSSGAAQNSLRSTLLTGNGTETVSANPLDRLSSADIAVHVARLTGLEESTSVANRADTIGAQLAVAPGEDKVAAKPQIVDGGLKSRKDIRTYKTIAGDTIASVAAKFGITSDTIRWSNNLTGDSLPAGKDIVISPVNGIVYTVAAGDSVDSIATRFRSNKEALIAFNDAELSGTFKPGERIVVPDALPPAPGRALASTANVNFAFGGFSAVYGGNGYTYGYCTWWAAVRRAQIGRPIPSNLGNASTWKSLAARAGIGVGGQPQAGAVIWTPPHDYYGHVGFVESVNEDGSVNVSEMNTAGWNKVSRKTLSAADAARFSYIY